VPGFAELWGGAVFHCPFCHGWEVRDRPVVVYGEGEVADRQAALVTAWTDDVTVVEPGDVAGLRVDAGALRAVVCRDGSEVAATRCSCTPRCAGATRVRDLIFGPHDAGSYAQRVPELPEAERARQTLESILGRRIADVDDNDTYVCRPHQPGEIAAALVGHEFVSAHRRGKFLWLVTDEGPTLGLHLGMAGAIALEAPQDKPFWDRFTVAFDDGTRFALRDRRRLGRAVLNPDYSHVGPDAAGVGRDDFRRLIGAGNAPVKARLLDQGAISGVGNLLADQALWQARIAPQRTTSALATEELDRLRRELRGAVRSAIRDGGVHTGSFVQARGRDGTCPRCGQDLARGTIGGRTTYWCPECQAGG
jgi:formamidopyrimidine-DNA glycosylase